MTGGLGGSTGQFDKERAIESYGLRTVDDSGRTEDRGDDVLGTDASVVPISFDDVLVIREWKVEAASGRIGFKKFFPTPCVLLGLLL